MADACDFRLYRFDCIFSNSVSQIVNIRKHENYLSRIRLRLGLVLDTWSCSMGSSN